MDLSTQINNALAELRETDLACISSVAERMRWQTRNGASGDLRLARKTARGQELFEFDAYSPQDDIKHLSWTHYRRTGELWSKRYEDMQTNHWLIAVDTSASMFAANAQSGLRAVQLAAAYAYVLLDRGVSVSMATFADRLLHVTPRGRGRTHYFRCLQTLRQTRTPADAQQTAFGSIQPVAARAQFIVFISDFYADDAQQTLQRLRARSGKVACLNIRSDILPPSIKDGWYNLQQIESGERIRVHVDTTSRRRAEDENALFHQTLTRWCHGFNIPMSTHVATERWQTIMQQHFSLLCRYVD